MSAEKDLSLVALVIGITSKKDNTFTTSESKEQLSPKLRIDSLRVNNGDLFFTNFA